jgi:hypothetical protein
VKVIKDEMATLKRHRRVTVELRPHEQLIAIDDRLHYQLGDPISDVVPGHIVSNAVAVYWCPVGQEWVVS